MQNVDTRSKTHNRSLPHTSNQIPSNDQPIVAVSSTSVTSQRNMQTSANVSTSVNASSATKPPTSEAVTTQSSVDSQLVHSTSPAPGLVEPRGIKSPQTIAIQNAPLTSVTPARHTEPETETRVATPATRKILTIGSLSSHNPSNSTPIRPPSQLPPPLTGLGSRTKPQLPVLSQLPINRSISSDRHTLFFRSTGIHSSQSGFLPAPHTIHPPLFSNKRDAYGRNIPTSRMHSIPPITSQQPAVSPSSHWPPPLTPFNVQPPRPPPSRHEPVISALPMQLPCSSTQKHSSNALTQNGASPLPPASLLHQYAPVSSEPGDEISFPNSTLQQKSDSLQAGPIPCNGMLTRSQRIPSLPNYQHNSGQPANSAMPIQTAGKSSAFAPHTVRGPSSSFGYDYRGAVTSAHSRPSNISLPQILFNSHTLNPVQVEHMDPNIQGFPQTGHLHHPHHPIPNAFREREREIFAQTALPAFHIGSHKRLDNQYQQRQGKLYGQASSSKDPTLVSESPSSVIIGTKTIVEDDGFLFQRIIHLEEKVGQSAQLAVLIRRTDEMIQSMSGLAGDMWNGPMMQTVDIRSKYPLAEEDIDSLLDDATSLAQPLYNTLRNYFLEQLKEIRQNAKMAEDALEKRLTRQRLYRPIPVAEVERRMQYVSQKFTKVREAIVEQMKDYVKNIKWVELSPCRVRRGSLNTQQNHVLRLWLFEHFSDPYPTPADKQMMILQTGLSLSQVNNWFINARVRVWKHPVDAIRMKRNAEESLKTIKAARERRRLENARIHKHNRLLLAPNATGSAVSAVEGGLQPVRSILPSTSALRIASSNADHQQRSRNSVQVRLNRSHMSGPTVGTLRWPHGASEAQTQGNELGTRAAQIASTSAVGPEYGSNRRMKPPKSQNNQERLSLPPPHQQNVEESLRHEQNSKSSKWKL